MFQDGREEYGSALPDGFQPLDTRRPRSRFEHDVNAACCDALAQVVGDDSAIEQLFRPGAQSFISAVTHWYAHHYGAPSPGGPEYEIEVNGLAELVTPHLVDVPCNFDPLAADVPYPPPGQVLGFDCRGRTVARQRSGRLRAGRRGWNG